MLKWKSIYFTNVCCFFCPRIGVCFLLFVDVLPFLTKGECLHNNNTTPKKREKRFPLFSFSLAVSCFSSLLAAHKPRHPPSGGKHRFANNSSILDFSAHAVVADQTGAQVVGGRGRVLLAQTLLTLQFGVCQPQAAQHGVALLGVGRLPHLLVARLIALFQR